MQKMRISLKMALICIKMAFYAQNMLYDMFFYLVGISKRLYICARYPENNLFTLKKLIPIENKKGVFVKRLLFYFYCFLKIIFLTLQLVSF